MVRRILVILCFLLVFGFVWQAKAAIIPATNPISAWLFNEGSDLFAFDSVGDNTGGLVDGVSWVTVTPFGGASNYALRFDGSSGEVRIFDLDDSLDFQGQAITLTAWVNPDAQPGENFVLGKRGPSENSGYDLQLSLQFDRLRWNTRDGAQPNPRAEATNVSFTTGEWFHVVIQMTNNLVTIFSNAVDVTTDGSAATILNNSIPFNIGGRPGGIGNHFQGVIDEVAFFDYILTQDEVDWLFENSMSQLFVPEPSEYVFIVAAVMACLFCVRKRNSKGDVDRDDKGRNA